MTLWWQLHKKKNCINFSVPEISLNRKREREKGWITFFRVYNNDFCVLKKKLFHVVCAWNYLNVSDKIVNILFLFVKVWDLNVLFYVCIKEDGGLMGGYIFLRSNENASEIFYWRNMVRFFFHFFFLVVVKCN